MTITIQTWDGNNINDGTSYVSWIEEGGWRLPPVSVVMAEREGRGPIVSNVDRLPHFFVIGTTIRGSGMDNKRKQLRQWFDPTDETPKQLVILGDAGNKQYIEAVCEEHIAESAAGNTFLTYIRVHDDTAWRASTSTTPSAWNITTGAASTNGYTNSGEFDVYPTYTITPTSAKSGANPHKRFMAVHWRADAATSYPTDIADDSLDTRIASTNFADAAGDDIRVYVDGVLTDYWLDGPNTATTKIWANINWKKGQTGITLKTALGTGSIETLDVNESISGFDSSGILQIDSEFFIYTAKNNSLKRFTIASRAAYGSTAATHSANATVRWLQHEIIITYGSASLSAHASDNNYQPVFTLSSSTNTSWDYDNFGEDDGLRTASWKGLFLEGYSDTYTANQGTDADPWSEIGLYRPTMDINTFAAFYLYNPCGITVANFQNGEKYAGTVLNSFTGAIQSGITGPNESNEYSIPVPTTAATWQAWSRNETLDTGSKYVGIILYDRVSGGVTDSYLEASDVTLTLNSSNTPSITIGVEDGNYNLDATITNNTTGQAISVSFQMDTSQSLTIDTWAGTVTYNKDSSSQYGAVTRLGGPRVEWLPLVPGSNVLQFEDTGTAGLTIAVSYEERYGA